MIGRSFDGIICFGGEDWWDHDPGHYDMQLMRRLAGEVPVLYVNSPGGGVYAGLAIYDTIQHMRAPVATFAVGIAASMAAVLVAAGEKGKRGALPNARIMIHQPSGGSQGTASDIEIAAKEILYTRTRLNEILAKHTGQTLEQIQDDVDRDRFMSPEEAVEYGLIDRVLEGPVRNGAGPKDSHAKLEPSEDAEDAEDEG